MTGTRIGPYELEGELGRGAMAVVWRARDTRLDREVALKEPVTPPGLDPSMTVEFAARFVREAKAAARLNHPGIVTIHNADVFDGRAVIDMELIEGETLAAMLARGPLPLGAALSVTQQLLDAVGYAHAHGIVHRDIKPDNVFVTAEGRIKLADFGIAHVGASATLTQAGTVMGTPGYMSPEQVTGDPIDARADIFAIGVVAYEAIVGRNPFGATDGVAPTTVMYRIVHEAAPALPPEALGAVPFDLARVLATAMAKDPVARFADAAAFMAALAGGSIVIAGGTGATVAGPSWPATSAASANGPGTAAMKWKPYIAVAAVMVVVLGALLIASGGGTPRMSNSVAQSATTPSSPAAAVAAAPVASVPQPPSDDEIRQGVRDTLARWTGSIDSMDLDAHMQCYAAIVDPYDNRRTTHDEVRASKAPAFVKYKAMNMSVENVNIVVSGPDTATADLVKRWEFRGAKVYSGAVRQQLHFQKIGGDWKIVGELEFGPA